MSTINQPLTQEEADSRHMMEHAFKGKPLNPDVSKRVRERAEKIRERLRKGPKTNIVLDLLHESRDE